MRDTEHDAVRVEASGRLTLMTPVRPGTISARQLTPERLMQIRQRVKDDAYSVPAAAEWIARRSSLVGDL